MPILVTRISGTGLLFLVLVLIGCSSSDEQPLISERSALQPTATSTPVTALTLALAPTDTPTPTVTTCEPETTATPPRVPPATCPYRYAHADYGYFRA